jgi:serine-type D-Ala-D-Ala carboxypeptidase/endopeptidase (penicillin-binding protein 4)
VAAAGAFATYLAAYGMPAKYIGRSAVPAGSTLVTASSSAPVRTLLSTMLSVSNNDFAEYLLRQAARAAGLRPTWRNSIANQRRLLAAAGVPLKGYVAYDGSGLSRADRMPVATLASVIRKLYVNGNDNNVVFSWGAIPRSGQTGTLANRFKVTAQSCARGQVLAKTGTLSDVVGLAGVARSTDGRDRVFVLLQNGVKKTSIVRKAIDAGATAVVGCRLG